MRPEAIVLAVLACAALWFWQSRTQRRFSLERAAVFDECTTLFEGQRVLSSGGDYPALTGRYRGARFELQPMLDHVGYRKVPSLWLSVTLREAQAVGGVFDLLVRPENIEFYSASAQLDERIDMPDGWPVHHLAKVSPAGWRPPLGALREAAGALVDEPVFKEMTVSPRGVRLMVRLGGVQRAHYMVLRSLLPESTRVSADFLQPVLDAALRMSAALSASAKENIQ
jgi:hypothetical protein